MWIGIWRASVRGRRTAVFSQFRFALNHIAVLLYCQEPYGRNLGKRQFCDSQEAPGALFEFMGLYDRTYKERGRKKRQNRALKTVLAARNVNFDPNLCSYRYDTIWHDLRDRCYASCKWNFWAQEDPPPLCWTFFLQNFIEIASNLWKCNTFQQ